MINDIINEQWQGHSHGEVEAALKLILQQILNELEQGVADGSIGREQLTQALKDAIDSIASKVPNIRRVNGKQLNADVTIGAGDIMVGSKTLSALLDEMQEDIEHAGGSGVTQQDIDDAIAALVAGAPQALDTLNELAAALGDNSNFAAAITQQLGTKQDVIPNLATIIANAGKGIADVSSPQEDGSFTITLANGDTYTVNLNHQHTQYQPLLTSANAGSNVTITTDQQGNIIISSTGGGGGGGISGITMNGNAVTVNNGVANLGTVLTQHQSLTGRVQSQDVVNIVKISQAAYDALPVKDSTTLYLITES
jgi:hypothetical protein